MPSRNPSSAGGAGEALERLGRLALRELSMESLLQAVADTAKSVMPGNSEASVFLSSPRGAGNFSSLSVPLIINDEGSSGALDIYAREVDAFDDDSRAAAIGFAPYASVAIGNMQEYESARIMVGNLQAALDSRAVIDQAKGILMERHKITADQAFQLLAHASMTTNTKVRDVAEHLVRTGELREQRER
ncbi:ANTAR domain-containing response regulator [Blastococcus sp. SYSU D00669]